VFQLLDLFLFLSSGEWRKEPVLLGPSGITGQHKSKLCYDWWLVGQSFLVSQSLGLMIRFLLLSDNCRFANVRRHLGWEDGTEFTIAARPCQRSDSGVSEFCGTHDHVLLPQISDFPTWRKQGGPIYTPLGSTSYGISIALGHSSELNTLLGYEIFYFRGSDYEECRLLRCYAVWLL
jgi:hypothetical protein